MGPSPSSRHAPTVILLIPLVPVGNKDPCQACRRSAGKGPGEALCCVHHHLDDALYVAVDVPEAADVHTEAAGDRRAYLLPVESLPFDFAALEYVLCKGFERGFLSEIETKGLHAANETALSIPDVSQRPGQAALVPMEIGPVGMLVDVYSPHHLRI